MLRRGNLSARSAGQEFLRQDKAADHFQNGMVADGTIDPAHGRARIQAEAAVDHLRGGGGNVQYGGEWEEMYHHKKKLQGAPRDHFRNEGSKQNNIYSGPRGKKNIDTAAARDHFQDAANVGEGNSQWENMRGKGGMHARPTNQLGNGVAIIPAGKDEWLDHKLRQANDNARNDHLAGPAIQAVDDESRNRGRLRLDNKAAAQDHLRHNAAVKATVQLARPMRNYHKRQDHFTAGGGGVISNGTDAFIAHRPGKIYNPNFNVNHLNSGLEVSEAQLKPQYPNRRYASNQNGDGQLGVGLMMEEDPFNPHGNPRPGYKVPPSNRKVARPPGAGTVSDWGSEMGHNFGRDVNVVPANAKKNSVIKNPDHGSYETMYGGVYGRDKSVVEQKFTRQPEINNRFETAYGGKFGRDPNVVMSKAVRNKEATMPYTSIYASANGRDPNVYHQKKQKMQLLL